MRKKEKKKGLSRAERCVGIATRGRSQLGGEPPGHLLAEPAGSGGARPALPGGGRWVLSAGRGARAAPGPAGCAHRLSPSGQVPATPLPPSPRPGTFRKGLQRSSGRAPVPVQSTAKLPPDAGSDEMNPRESENQTFS